MFSKTQAYRLRQAGFLQQELDRWNRDLLAKPQKVDLTTGTWKSVMEGRRRWRAGWKKRGLSKFSIDQKLRDFYVAVGDTFSPFDFLKLEYWPPKRVKAQRFQIAKRRRAQRVLDKHMGAYRSPGPAARKATRPSTPTPPGGRK